MFFMFMSMSAQIHRLEASLVSLSYWKMIFYLLVILWLSGKTSKKVKKRKLNFRDNESSEAVVYSALFEVDSSHLSVWKWSFKLKELQGTISPKYFCMPYFSRRTRKQSEGDWLRQRYQIMLSVVPSIKKQMPFWNECPFQRVELSRRQQSMLKKSLQKLLTLWG